MFNGWDTGVSISDLRHCCFTSQVHAKAMGD